MIDPLIAECIRMQRTLANIRRTEPERYFELVRAVRAQLDERDDLDPQVAEVRSETIYNRKSVRY